MTVLLFIFGVILCTLIARYNESNKLFWQLFTSFVIGFTAGTMFYQCTHSDERSEDYPTQVCPMQDFGVASGSIMNLLADVPQPITLNANSPLASQVNTPAKCGLIFASSKVSVKTRDQPRNYMPIGPPIGRGYFDTS